MTRETFAEAITQLDGELLERYFAIKADLNKPKKAIGRAWVKWAAVAACFALVAVSGLPAIHKLSSVESTPSYEGPSAPEESSLPEGVYVLTHADWPIYGDGEALAEQGDLIFAGRVTAIGFQVLDLKTALPATEETKPADRRLYTIYTVEVLESYKGEPGTSLKVRIMGGMAGYEVEKQLEVMESGMVYGREDGIPLLEDYRNLRCDVGGAYLFVLAAFETCDPTILNPCQSIFDLREPETAHSVGGKPPLISAKDVILEFGMGAWNRFEEQREQGFFDTQK